MAHHVCPAWLGGLLASPLRKLVQDPLKILGGDVRPGMKVLDVGPGMGFFSLPLAQLVGEEGCVVCADLQPGMLEGLMRRARRAGLAERIMTRKCEADSLKLEDFAGEMDFVLAFGVVHETPDAFRFMQEIACVLKSGGRALAAEPKGRVREREFQVTVGHAVRAGFRVVEPRRIWRTRAVLMEKVRRNGFITSKTAVHELHENDE